MTGQTFTREQVSSALNGAAEMVLDSVYPTEYSGSIRARSLVDLVVNAAMSVLDSPGLSDLDAIIEDNYDADAETVKGWAGG